MNAALGLFYGLGYSVSYCSEHVLPRQLGT